MSAKTLLKVGVTLCVLLMTAGFAEAQVLRSDYVVDSIPGPRNGYNISVNLDSSGYLRVLYKNVDTLMFKIDPASHAILDSVRFVGAGNPWGAAYAYDKFWFMVQSYEYYYVYKFDTLGRKVGQFRVPTIPPASSGGLCFEGDKLWISSVYDSFWISGVYQTDTLGSTRRFVRVPNSAIGTPGYIAYWSKEPGTLFICTWQGDLCQVTTDDTVATLVRAWPSPFPPSEPAIHGCTFDRQGFFWAVSFFYPWILKLDLGLTGVAGESKSLPIFPKVLRLHPPEPTPTSSKATILFELPRTAGVKLTLVNVAGGRVRLLNEGVLRAGSYRILWDGKNDQGQRVPSGVYFLKLEALGQSAVQRVVVVR
jgi:FlgD Ig-like domain